MGRSLSDQQRFCMERRRLWSEIFGLYVREMRTKLGRSVEETARLAGMEPLDWIAVESGVAPHPAQLRPMADALELRYDKMGSLAILCRDAWEV